MDKLPALIARCEGVADVIAAVNFAHDNNIILGLPGGGHNVAGLGAVRSRGASQNFAGPTDEEKVLVQRNGILDSISFTVARATIPTNYWASG